jgi:hypothetical protein
MNILDFMSDLARDPSRQLAFARDPEGFVRTSGLSDDDARAVVSRDPEQLRNPASAVIYTSESAIVYSAESAP